MEDAFRNRIMHQCEILSESDYAKCYERFEEMFRRIFHDELTPVNNKKHIDYYENTSLVQRVLDFIQLCFA